MLYCWLFTVDEAGEVSVPNCQEETERVTYHRGIRKSCVYNNKTSPAGRPERFIYLYSKHLVYHRCYRREEKLPGRPDGICMRVTPGLGHGCQLERIHGELL
jgi:hypothetical protein